MKQRIDDRAVAGRLLQFGMWLFLMGLLTGLMMPLFANPRMGLASHLEGIMNGMFMVSMGLLWAYLQLSDTLKRVVLALAVFGTFSNWLATFLAAYWGAGSMMAIASGGIAGTPWQEVIISALLMSLSFAMVLLVAILIYGLRRVRTTQVASNMLMQKTAG
jgi:hydroxylaminobenzene mutase